MTATVAAIWRYPVKAMMGEALNAALVTAGGLAGDRGYALFEPATGRIATGKIQRKWRPVFQSRARYDSEPDGTLLPPARITLPDGSLASTDDADISERFSALLGFEAVLTSEKPGNLLLESPPLGTVPDSEDDPTMDFPVVNGFFDLGAVHLLTTSTLDRLRSLYPEGRFDPRRFRPNLIVETPDEEGFVENTWPGKTIEIGEEVRLRVISPTIRCVVTTMAQDDLPYDPEILKTAAQHNQANVGVYAMVERGGLVRRGDAVVVP